MDDAERQGRRAFLRGLAGGALAALPMRATSQPAAPRRQPIAALLAEAVSVLDFIPAEMHAAIRAERNEQDVAPYINEAIRQVMAQPGGGTIFFPAGAYDVSEIDASNADPARFGQVLRLIGAGRLATKIRPAGSGAVLLNALGRNELQVESLQFHAAAFEAQAAILLGRTEASPNCNGNMFRDLLIGGNYSKATVIAFAAESTTWAQCEFRNSNRAARHRCFVTSHDPAILPVETRHGGRPVASSNTDNVMLDCEFYTPHDGAAPVLFAGAAGYTMQACTILGGDARGTRLVTYRPERDTFSGPVSWQNPHLEVLGPDAIVHFLEAPAGVSYFRGINNYSGNYVIGSDTAILGYAGSAPNAQPVLMQSTWTTPMVPWASRNVTFSVFGLADSSVEFALADGVGTLEVRGYASNSRFRAGIERVARVVPRG